MSNSHDTCRTAAGQAELSSIASDALQVPTATASQPRAAGRRIDKAVAARFLAELLSPGVGCLEIRVFDAEMKSNGTITKGDRYPRTMAGVFKDVEAAVHELSYISGVSAFATINPVMPAFLARDNARTIKPVKLGEGASDKQIVDLRNLFVDIDPIRAGAICGISATEEEMAWAIEVRDKILADHPAIRAASWWGCSGNGAWILIHIGGLPNDAEHNRLVERVLACLGRVYSIEGRAEIDQSTKNPSRIIGIPGTRKCKGRDLCERPHRLATIETTEGHVRQIFRIRDWLAGNDATPGVPVSNSKLNPGLVAPSVDRWWGDPSEEVEIIRALDYIRVRAEKYPDWIGVGMALSPLGERGLDLWDDWSKHGEKYEPGRCAKLWAGLKPDGGLGVGSIFHWAAEAGWQQPSRRARSEVVCRWEDLTEDDWFEGRAPMPRFCLAIRHSL